MELETPEEFDYNKSMPGRSIIRSLILLFFLSVAICNFVISAEFHNNADDLADLGARQQFEVCDVEDSKAEFVDLANDQYQLMQVDIFDCWKYPLWKIGLLEVDRPYTTYDEAVNGQLYV